MNPTPVVVFSDYVCPFCYMAYASLERARQQLPLDVSWRAFELRPAGSPPMEEAYRARIEENWPRTQAMGRQYGVAFNAPIRFGVNSHDAHRAAAIVERLAPAQADGYRSALFRAHFSEGQDIGDPEVLVALAAPLGVDGEALRAALAAGEGHESVQQDQEEAHALGLSGVPAMIFAGKYLASGALPTEQIVSAVERIRAAPEADD